jgi:hypothetical protein
VLQAPSATRALSETTLTKLLAFAALVLLIVLAILRLRSVFLASSRGQEMLALWRLLRQLGGAGGAGPGPGPSARTASTRGAPPSGEAARPIPLIRCAGCGTHVPEGSARRRQWGVFCSEACEHRARS